MLQEKSSSKPFLWISIGLLFLATEVLLGLYFYEQINNVRNDAIAYLIRNNSEMQDRVSFGDSDFPIKDIKEFCFATVDYCARSERRKRASDKPNIADQFEKLLQLLGIKNLDELDSLQTLSVSGPVGPPGVPGVKGDKGYPGFPGMSGMPGRPGIIGSKGEMGMPGFPGVRGITGEKGDKGDSIGTCDGGPIPSCKGFVEKGDKGEPGIQGLDGFPGPKGEFGLVGYPGMPGRKGDKGEKGDSIRSMLDIN